MTIVDPPECRCPKCGARPGAACMTPQGFRCATHSARKPKRYSSFTNRPTPGSLEHQAVMDELRPLVFERDGHACVRCGSRQHLQAHHRLPTGRGGRDTLENLVTLCGPAPRGCHGWVHDHDSDAHDAGLLFYTWEGNPTEAFVPPGVRTPQMLQACADLAKLPTPEGPTP